MSLYEHASLVSFAHVNLLTLVFVVHSSSGSFVFVHVLHTNQSFFKCVHATGFFSVCTFQHIFIFFFLHASQFTFENV